MLSALRASVLCWCSRTGTASASHYELPGCSETASSISTAFTEHQLHWMRDSGHGLRKPISGTTNRPEYLQYVLVKNLFRCLSLPRACRRTRRPRLRLSGSPLPLRHLERQLSATSQHMDGMFSNEAAAGLATATKVAEPSHSALEDIHVPRVLPQRRKLTVKHVQVQLILLDALCNQHN